MPYVGHDSYVGYPGQASSRISAGGDLLYQPLQAEVPSMALNVFFGEG